MDRFKEIKCGISAPLFGMTGAEAALHASATWLIAEVERLRAENATMIEELSEARDYARRNLAKAYSENKRYHQDVIDGITAVLDAPNAKADQD